MILLGIERLFSKKQYFSKKQASKQKQMLFQCDIIVAKLIFDFPSWKCILLFEKLCFLTNDQCEINYSMVNVLDIEQYQMGKTHMCLYNRKSCQYRSIAMCLHRTPGVTLQMTS